eukprot:scaffold28716_cov107-Isochrysis_galbana.AAC.3
MPALAGWQPNFYSWPSSSAALAQWARSIGAASGHLYGLRICPKKLLARGRARAPYFRPPPDVCAHAQAAARLRPRKAAAAAPPPDALLRSLRALLADATDVQDGAGLLPRAAESALTAPAGSVP